MYDHHSVKDLDRLRSLYHYYKAKDDLLSLCKSEVIREEMNRIKAKNKANKYSLKVREFLHKHPQYEERFK